MSDKVTILDVAKKSGFGVGTVSRVISGDKYVKESTRKTILKVIEELNFSPNVNGARLRQKHNKVIAILVPIINHPFFAEFVEHVNNIASTKGYSTLLVVSRMNVDKEKEILRKIRQKEVDGAIFVTHYEHEDEEIRGLPLVSVDRHLNHSVPYVSSDNYDASKKAVEYLVSTGAKKIGFIGTKPFVDSEVLFREKAYQDVVAGHHLTSYITNEVVEHGEEEKLVDKFLKAYPDLDAIFASGMTTAQILYQKLKKKGVKFPDDMQLINYDGEPNLWDNHEIEISSIQQPIKEMAEGAFNLLVDVINGKEIQIRNIYTSTFIKGNTTK